MKKIIMIVLIISFFYNTNLFCDELSFKADDFKNYVDYRITVVLKNSYTILSYGTLYLKEVNDKYIVCYYQKLSDSDIVYILIDQIASFRVQIDKKK